MMMAVRHLDTGTVCNGGSVKEGAYSRRSGRRSSLQGRHPWRTEQGDRCGLCLTGNRQPLAHMMAHDKYDRSKTVHCGPDRSREICPPVWVGLRH